jgi:hypothetical protein
MTPAMTNTSVWKRSSSWIPANRYRDRFQPNLLVVAVAGWTIDLLADGRCSLRLRFLRLVHQEIRMSILIGWQGWKRDRFHQAYFNGTKEINFRLRFLRSKTLEKKFNKTLLTVKRQKATCD